MPDEAPAACICGCRDPDGAMAHAIVAALALDDLDRAIALGLVERDAVACGGCDESCQATLLAARTARLDALAARDRYRVRNARLERRARERAEQRAAATPAAPSSVAAPVPALPSAAAAALARARAKAAERHKP